MLSEPKFMCSKIIVVMSNNEEKLSFKNDNLIVTGKDGVIKLQCSCYKLFAVFVVGGISITTGIIERSKRFGFSIILFSAGFKVYQTINFKAEGNTLLRSNQYNTPHSLVIAKSIIINKIVNQIETLKKLREKDDAGIKILKSNLIKINSAQDLQTIMGYEGICAKAYFNRIFQGFDWDGRKPRIKHNAMNLLLDIGYTVLFNYLEAIFGLYGFDLYKGNLHQQFYNRKSLICDVLEPFRPIIDYSIRKALNLGKITKDDYRVASNGKYEMSWKSSSKVIELFVQTLSDYRQSIFRYAQRYYRWFMRNWQNLQSELPQAEIKVNDFD